MGGKTKKQTKSAFTLVELLIVVTIVAIMTGVLMVNQKTGNGPKYDVDMAARELTALIHEQQTNATEGQEINIGGVQTKVCGVGISWSANASTVNSYYQKNDNAPTINTLCNDTNMNYGSTQFKNVSISSLANGGGFVFFKLPFAGMSQDSNPEKIIIESTINPAVTHTVCVYPDSVKDFTGTDGCCC